ncbi:hypothetical protein TUBRATIS_28480 [Tubulinosema ratisbonensis]|uniref:DNA replication complex GINS protein PSF1 n=1 Tax=Tubulinosema ratisbonensis TaxID=291195 RepID=A0A437AHS3_9MICR|nr:hypothetical protein TUBRATIS_28480 [Tubulinosema ratisbonensis]
MKLGEPATKLLKELTKQNLSTNKKDLILQIEEENTFLTSKLIELQTTTEEENLNKEISYNFLLINNQLKRNLRIIKAYKFNLIKQIIDLIYKNEIKDLSLENKNIFNKIKSYFETRIGEFSFLDYAFNEPPLRLYIQIYTKRDCGVVFDGDNLIELKENRFYYVKKCLVEHLIGLDYVEIIE